MKKLFIALTALALTLTSMAQVTKTVNSYAAGTLAIQLGSDLATVTHLTITGYIDARDFVVLRDAMTQLEELDLSGAIIQSYTGSEGTYTWQSDYPANELPLYAFNNPSGNNNRYNFKKVITPNTTTKIGVNAFSSNYYLTNITLNSGLTSIGSDAFSSCNQISSISIPNTVTSIGNSAFSSCNALTGEITLPSSLSDFGTYVFGGCTKITGYTINSSNQKFSTESGVIFNKDKTTIILYPIDKEGSYTIPNSVTKIANSAFSGCTKLSGSITIPNSVTTIESYSFDNCTGLSGTLTLGSGLQTIGDNAFYNCSGITDFALTATNVNFEVVGGVLFNKAKTTLLLYPPGKAGSYTIPSSVTSIGKNAFRNCRKLSGDLIIPNTLTTIGDNSFESCSGLDGTLTLGTGLTSIGGSAFSSCNGIKVINCLRITPPTTSSWAFYFSKYPTVYTPSAAAATAYKAATGWTNFPTILAPGFSISSTYISGLNYVPGATSSDAKFFTISGSFLSGDITINAPTNFEISLISGSSFSPKTSLVLTQVGGMIAIDTVFVRLKSGLSANTYTGNISIASVGITSQNISLSGIVRTMPELINITTPGTLSNSLSFTEKSSITKLKVTGSIDVRDIKCVRDEMTALADLDLSEANIVAYNGNDGTYWYSEYLANELPPYSFLNTSTWKGKTTLTSIKLPNSLTSIGNSAFYYCTGLIGTVTIPNLVTSIGESAFNYCTGLNSITFGNSITTIGNNAFSYCSSIEGNLIIPSTVTTIGESAFLSCTKVTSVTLGSSLNKINSYAFNGCSILKYIYSLNETPPSLGEYVFSYDYSSYSQKVFVPSTTAVANYKADSKWQGFLVRPSGITLSTTNIANLNYVPNNGPSDVKSFTILGAILQGDLILNVPANFEISTSPAPNFTGNTSITLNQVDGVVELDTIYVRLKSALATNTYTGNLTITSTGYTTNTIPLTGIVRDIPELINMTTAGTLSGSLSATEKSSITKLKLTGNIDARDFKCIRDELTGLTDLDLSEVNIVAYNGLDGTHVYTYYGETVGPINYYAKTFPEYAFKDKKILKTITIPTLLEGISYNAFNGCGIKIYSTLLTPPINTNLNYMGLTNSIVYVPIGKVDIYKTAWGTGTNVLIIDKDIEVTVNVTEAGKLATTIYNQTASHPTLVTKLTVTGVLNATDISYIRDNMNKCHDVNLEGVNMTILPNDAFKSREFLFSVKMPLNMKTIGTNAFNGCINIKALEIPNAVTSIGDNSFYGCVGLSSIKIPSSVASIGGSAFSGCSGLSSIIIPSNVTSIGNYAFSGCLGLNSINFTSSVTSIGDYAFQSCTGLSSATFNGATTIGYRAFSGCTNLNAAIFQGATTFGGYSFKDCSKLTNLTVSGVSSIADYAFASCSGLTSIKLDRVGSIGIGAFNVCTSLRTATISGSTTIGNSAFQGCAAIESVILDGATSIGNSSFNYCPSLTTIDIPSSVTSIGDAAFQSCSKMDSVSIGAKVSTIGAGAFSGCGKLSKIKVYRLTPAALGLNVFSGVNTQACKLRLLESADFDAYFSAAQWGSFLNVESMSVSDKMGDSNEDGVINITDIINVINYILEKPVTKFSMLYSDMNKDGGINVIDVVQIVKVITGGPTGAPRLKAKGMQQAGCTWDMVGNTFVAQADGGIRGFDVAYTGTYTALPALDDFSLVPYTKNGVKRLLGYTTGDAICMQPTSLFTLSDGGAFSDMTFVLDDGNNAPLVKGITTATASTEINPTVVIENGFIRLQNSDNLNSIELYSLSGNLMARSLTNQLAIPSPVKGVYLLRINTAGQKLSYKVVL